MSGSAVWPVLRAAIALRRAIRASGWRGSSSRPGTLPRRQDAGYADSGGRYRPLIMTGPSAAPLGTVAREALLRAIAERLGEPVPTTAASEEPTALREAVDQLAALVVAGRGTGGLLALRAHLDLDA